MKLRDRIGVDISRRLKLEDAIEWAAKNGLQPHRHPARHRGERAAEVRREALRRA